MINFEVLMEVMLLWFVSPERRLLCAQILGMRYRNRGFSTGLQWNLVSAIITFICSKHVSDIFLFCFSVFLVSGDGVILICSSCDPGVPKSQT